MFDDLLYDLVIFNKGDNAHGSPAFGIDEGIVELRDFVELSFFICTSLCDQKVEVRMEVYPASE
jgi:hypothetical protein